MHSGLKQLLCLCLQLFADTHVGGTWSVRRPTRVAANQDTLDLTVRQVSE